MIHNRSDIETRVREDMSSTLRDYGIDPRKRDEIGPGLIEALVEDVMFQIDKIEGR